MDDIIFGSSNNAFSNEFSKLMTDRFEMSMMGELKFFLGFEIKQLSEGTFISQAKFTQDILKKFNMHEAKGKRFPMDTKCHLELNPKGVDADQSLYRSMIGSLLYCSVPALRKMARYLCIVQIPGSIVCTHSLR